MKPSDSEDTQLQLKTCLDIRNSLLQIYSLMLLTQVTNFGF